MEMLPVTPKGLGGILLKQNIQPLKKKKKKLHNQDLSVGHMSDQVFLIHILTAFDAVIVYSFNTYLLNAYFLPGTVSVTQDI